MYTFMWFFAKSRNAGTLALCLIMDFFLASFALLAFGLLGKAYQLLLGLAPYITLP